MFETTGYSGMLQTTALCTAVCWAITGVGKYSLRHEYKFGRTSYDYRPYTINKDDDLSPGLHPDSRNVRINHRNLLHGHQRDVEYPRSFTGEKTAN